MAADDISSIAARWVSCLLQHTVAEPCKKLFLPPLAPPLSSLHVDVCLLLLLLLLLILILLPCILYLFFALLPLFFLCSLALRETTTRERRCLVLSAR